MTHQPIKIAFAMGEWQQERPWEAGKGALTLLQGSGQPGNAIYCWFARAPE